MTLRGSRKHTLRKRFLEFQRNTCLACGSRIYEEEPQCSPYFVTLEHIIPQRCGGTHKVTNLAVTCQRCNSGNVLYEALQTKKRLRWWLSEFILLREMAHDRSIPNANRTYCQLLGEASIFLNDRTYETR